MTRRIIYGEKTYLKHYSLEQWNTQSNQDKATPATLERAERSKGDNHLEPLSQKTKLGEYRE